MPKIKVLQLEFWMDAQPFCNKETFFGDPDDPYMLKTYPETVPVFNRDGLYKCGNVSWFEVDGRAFTYNVDTFNHSLDTLHGEELTNEKFKALGAIVRVKLATRKQYAMYRSACHALECRGIRRRTRKFMLTIRRK